MKGLLQVDGHRATPMTRCRCVEAELSSLKRKRQRVAAGRDSWLRHPLDATALRRPTYNFDVPLPQ